MVIKDLERIGRMFDYLEKGKTPKEIMESEEQRLFGLKEDCPYEGEDFCVGICPCDFYENYQNAMKTLKEQDKRRALFNTIKCLEKIKI